MDTFDAFDQISAFKQETLPQMRTAIDELKQLTEDGEKRLGRLKRLHPYKIAGNSSGVLTAFIRRCLVKGE